MKMNLAPECSFLDWVKIATDIGDGNTHLSSRNHDFPEIFQLTGKEKKDDFRVYGSIQRLDLAIDTNSGSILSEISRFFDTFGNKGRIRDFYVDGEYTGRALYFTGTRGWSLRVYRKDLESPDMYDTETWRIEFQLTSRLLREDDRIGDWNYQRCAKLATMYVIEILRRVGIFPQLENHFELWDYPVHIRSEQTVVNDFNCLIEPKHFQKFHAWDRILRNLPKKVECNQNIKNLNPVFRALVESATILEVPFSAYDFLRPLFDSSTFIVDDDNIFGTVFITRRR